MKLTRLVEAYSQDEDCCGRVDETGQDIEIEIVDGGGGPYAVIKTERWALSDDDGGIKQFVKVLKAAIARVK